MRAVYLLGSVEEIANFMAIMDGQHEHDVAGVWCANRGSVVLATSPPTHVAPMRRVGSPLRPCLPAIVQRRHCIR